MAILTFLFRLRFAILALLVVATAGAAYFAFRDHAVPAGALFFGSASLLIAAIVAFIQLRHLGLALLAALAPLPGMIAAGPFALRHGVPVAMLLAVYGYAYAAAALLCGDIARRILDSVEKLEVTRTALARAFLPAAGSAIAVAALSAGWLFQTDRLPALAGAGLASAAILSVMVFVPFAASVMPFGENFFTIANQTLERRERMLRLVAKAVEPRWGLSLSGVSLVVAALGWFGAEPFASPNTLLMQPLLWAASVLLVFLVAWLVGRDWRDAVAATLASSVLALLGVWLWGRVARHLGPNAVLEIATVMGVALHGMLTMIDRSRRYRATGDAPDVARLRAIEEIGFAPWLGMVGAVGATLPWLLLHGSVVTLVVLFFLAGAAALVAMPAIATALQTIVPRRRSVDELYGRG